jgi:hypothetical protein
LVHGTVAVTVTSVDFVDVTVPEFLAVSTTLNVPPAAYVCVGLVVVTATVPSPKFQLYDVALVEVFVKLQVRPVQL